MASVRQHALIRFDDMDRQIRAVAPGWTSLCPQRNRPTALHDIGEALLTEHHEASVVEAFTDALCRVVAAKFDQFPDDIFGDVDHLAASLLSRGDADEIRDASMRVIALFEGYGRSSPIHFRYVHDFTYGYDWARWVAGDPAARRFVAPFDDEFLSYLQRRRGELVDRIAAGEEKYRWTPDGVHRNTFRFSREPDDERHLHQALARDHQVPVQAWRFDGPSEWERPFRQIRDEYASRLSLPRRPQDVTNAGSAPSGNRGQSA
jgi:hypothetical protein